MSEFTHPIDLDQVRRAAAIIDGVAHHTPVFRSRTLDERCGGRVALKAENLQRGGAFKFRGAYTALAAMDADARAAGVVAFSSGNHAQAVALAARLWQTRATIVMPADAPGVEARGHPRLRRRGDHLRPGAPRIARPSPANWPSNAA